MSDHEPTRALDPTVQRLQRGTGALTRAAVQQMDERLPWYRELSPQDRSWVGLVAGSGIAAFVEWYRRPNDPVQLTNDIFGSAPRELTRSISLQHTLDLLRIVVDVIEQRASLHVAPGAQQAVREAVLRFSREVAFAAAQLYAQAAETRGIWDARLEALVVDSLIHSRSEDDAETDLASRAAALGWTQMEQVAVVAGIAPEGPIEEYLHQLRGQARQLGVDALVGAHGRRVVVVLGGTVSPGKIAEDLARHFGPGPVVLGPTVTDLSEAARSARAALAGLAAAPAWPLAPRPVEADDLLPERLLNGDLIAGEELLRRGYLPLRESSGGTVLVTVETFLACGSSIEQTARRMFIHANTVRYRLRRATELTGWDPSQARSGFHLRTAILLGRLHADEPHQPL